MGNNALKVQAAARIGDRHVFISGTPLCVGDLNDVIPRRQVIDGEIGSCGRRGTAHRAVPGNQVVRRAADHSDQNRARLATDAAGPGRVDDEVTAGNDVNRMRAAAPVGGSNVYRVRAAGQVGNAVPVVVGRSRAAHRPRPVDGIGSCSVIDVNPDRTGLTAISVVGCHISGEGSPGIVDIDCFVPGAPVSVFYKNGVGAGR